MPILINDISQKYIKTGGLEKIIFDIKPYVVDGTRNNYSITLYINIYSGGIVFKKTTRDGAIPTFTNPSFVYGEAGLANPGIVAPMNINFLVQDLYLYSEEASEFAISTIYE
jgi:hypothetical protein